MKKKLFSAVLSLTLVIGMLPTTIFAHGIDGTFADMPDDYSTAALEAAVANDLLQGNNGKISPDDSLTRAEMATILVRAFGATEQADLSAFTDMVESAWYYDSVAQAVQMGLFVGSDNKMTPDTAITRQEVCAVLTRAFLLSATDSDVLDSFSDGASISSWAVDSMAAMVDAGYIAGDTDGNLSPLDEMTRKDFAVVMSRLVDGYITAANTYDNDMDGTLLVRVPDVTLADMDIADSLILSDGIGDGDVILDGITVGTTTLIRGNGANSIYAKGGADLADVIIYHANAPIVLKFSGSASADSITVYSNDVTITGLPAGTQVIVADGVDGTSVNGTSVAAGQTVTATTTRSSSSSSSSSSSKSYTISVAGTTLTDATYDTLTIAESVGDGAYYLVDCTITNLVTYGGGVNSGYLVGGSYDTIELKSAPAEGSRLVFSDGVTVGTIVSAVPSILETEGTASVASVTASQPLVVNHTALDNLTVSSDLSVTGGSVAALAVSGEGTAIQLNDTAVTAGIFDTTESTLTLTGVASAAVSGTVDTLISFSTGTVDLTAAEVTTLVTTEDADVVQSESSTASAVSLTLDSIAITTLPIKTEYAVGDEMDNSGMVVTATYLGSDDQTYPTAVTGYTTDFTSEEVGVFSVTVFFDGKTDSYEITVTDSLLAAQTAAVDTLNTYWAGNLQTDYSETNQVAILTAQADGETAINAATSEAEVATALENAKTTIDAVQTLTEESQAVLDVAANGVASMSFDGVDVSSCANQSAVEAYLVDFIASEVDNAAVTVAVTGSYVAAVDGTADDVDGTDGHYSLTQITLSTTVPSASMLARTAGEELVQNLNLDKTFEIPAVPYVAESTELPLISQVSIYQTGMYLVGYIENPADTTGIESYELCLQSSTTPEKNISRNILVDGTGEGYFSLEALSSTQGDVIYDSILVYTKPISSAYTQVISTIAIEPITIQYGSFESEGLTYYEDTGYLSAPYTVVGDVGTVAFMGSTLYTGEAGSYTLLSDISSTYTGNISGTYQTYLGNIDEAITETITAGILVGAMVGQEGYTLPANPADTAITGAYYLSDYIPVTHSSSDSAHEDGIWLEDVEIYWQFADTSSYDGYYVSIFAEDGTEVNLGTTSGETIPFLSMYLEAGSYTKIVVTPYYRDSNNDKTTIEADSMEIGCHITINEQTGSGVTATFTDAVGADGTDPDGYWHNYSVTGLSANAYYFLYLSESTSNQNYSGYFSTWANQYGEDQSTGSGRTNFDAMVATGSYSIVEISDLNYTSETAVIVTRVVHPWTACTPTN